MNDQGGLNNDAPVTNDGVKNEDLAQQSNEVVFDSSAERKNNKTTVILSAVVAVMAVVIAVVFAYLYFTNLPCNSGDDETGKGQSSEEQSGDSGNGGSSENVGRDEADIIEELKEKVGVILGKIEDDNVIRIGRSIDSNDMTLFSEGVMSVPVNIIKAIKFYKPDTISLSDDQINTILNKGTDAFSDEIKKYLESNRDGVAFSGDDVAYAYEKLFGIAIVHQSAMAVCPGYTYDSELNVYYRPMAGGCGGMTDYNRQYYVYDYDVTGDNAYVYIVAASSNGEGELLCDVYTYDELNSGESINICGSVSDPENLINSSNYQDFAKYRFVFNKADDGTYYFVKVEKL